MPDLQSRLQASLAVQYRLERELGGGGMSRVFLAEEIALGRKVVIKVLPPELSGALNPERFQRGVRLAAALQHPHVVPLLTAGEANGILYYSMPYIAGESLRARIDREGALPVPEATRILRDVAAALAYAHAQGVVHRDIKPDNVLITHHHAVVTDFGIAKALSEAGGTGTLTATGVSLGTPAYMAPEQATGDSHVDQRADIYSLGALGYEMLAGEPPFRGPNAQALIAAHLTRTPVPLRELRPTVPAALAALLARCLEKHPGDRIQNAEAFLSQLEAVATPASGTVRPVHPVRGALLFGLAGLAVLAATYLLVRALGLPDWVFLGAIALLVVGFPIMLLTRNNERRRRRALLGGGLAFATLGLVTALFVGLRMLGVGPFATLLTAGTLKDRDPLLVADFENHTADSTLTQSITEALRIDLTRSHAVRILETADIAASLRRMDRDPSLPLTPAVAREVAQREGGKAVVSGAIAPLGNGFSLTVRLIAAADGATLAAERETASDATGLIAAVDRLSRKVRERIGESLRSIRADEPLEQVTTTSLEALRKYSQADRELDTGTMPRARALLTQAIALDSNFAMAHRQLAVILDGMRVDRTLRVAAARKAVALRDHLPERERLQAMAFYHMALREPPDSTIAIYRQLLETWPEDKIALNNLSILLYVKRRYVEAAEVARRGIAVSPRSATLYNNAIDALATGGRLAEAESVFAAFGAALPSTALRMGQGNMLANAEGDYDRADGYADSLARRGIATAIRISHRWKGSRARLRGRLARAAADNAIVVALTPQTGDWPGTIENSIWTATDQLIFLGRSDRAIREVDSILTAHPLDSLPAADRPYLELADFFALAGKLERAERLVSEYDRVVPPEIRSGDAARPFAAGVLALARGRGREAVAAFRSSRDHGCAVCGLWEIGQAFETMHMTDSALVVYDSLATIPIVYGFESQFTLQRAYRRLGELYEEKGDAKRALLYYGKFAALWKDADPELQPVVQDVRKRMERLGAGPKP